MFAKDVAPTTKVYEFPGIAVRPRMSLPPLPDIPREPLVQRIDEVVQGRLALLVAPAGWGKSSVLAAWARHTSLQVAWVDCARDGHAGIPFVKAVVDALEALDTGIGEDLHSMLRSPRPLPIPQVFSALSDAIEGYGKNLAVVLDDFQAVEDVATRDGVHALAAHGPRNLRVVIASRVAPDWSFARMRVNGDLVEFGLRELAFDEAEIRELLGPSSLSEDDARMLHQRSRGWPAGIRLAKLWLASGQRPRDLLSLLAGSNRDIADYMTEEILGSLPESTLRFLQVTAAVPRFCVSLASVLMGQDAVAELRNVERQGLFLIPLDPNREWFRYHDLFREYLQGRYGHLDGQAPGRNVVLCRAGEWFHANGLYADGVSCLLEAGDFEGAAQALDRSAEHMILREGDTLTFVTLADRIPAGIRAAHPDLQRFYAWALVLIGKLEDAESLANHLEHPGEDDVHRNPASASEVAAIRARVAAYRGDHDGTVAWAQQALERSEPDAEWVRADALLSVGFAHRAMGRLDDACDAFGNASLIGWRTGFWHAALWGSRYQSLTYLSRARLRDAASQIEDDIGRARVAGMMQGAAYAALLVSRGEVRYEHNDLEAARDDLFEALRLARAAGDAKILMNVHVAIAMLEQSAGNLDAAREAARRAVRVFDGTSEKAIEARIALRQGNTSKVREWMEGYLRTQGDSPSLVLGEVEQVMLARALMALDEPERAYAFLKALLLEAESTGRYGASMPIRMLLSQLEEQRGDMDAAGDHARAVLTIASREGYVRSILDEGPGFLRVLAQVVRRDSTAAQREYARALLGTATNGDLEEDASSASAMVESLTPRQQEVLRLMADGRSNREIADELFLSEGTVKAHLHQIFGKLMVRNRAEAIRVAQRFGLAV
jgi:LuxR family transcriptional regulator, maltose regulon positive regulatory protein